MGTLAFVLIGIFMMCSRYLPFSVILFATLGSLGSIQPAHGQTQDGTVSEEETVSTDTVSSAAISIVNASQVTAGLTVADGGVRQTLLENAGNASVGIQMFNQNNGDGTSQGNVTAFSLGGGETTGFSGASVAAQQVLLGTRVKEFGGSLSNSIENAFNDASGYAGINQSAGSANQQLNLLALSFGEAGAGSQPLGDAELSVVGIRGNVETEVLDDPLRNNSINNSFNNYRGVVQLHQTAGHANQVSNTINASIRVLPAGG
jgi:hypothetical protein